jgi:hypothetical protein
MGDPTASARPPGIAWLPRPGAAGLLAAGLGACGCLAITVGPDADPAPVCRSPPYPWRSSRDGLLGASALG